MAKLTWSIDASLGTRSTDGQVLTNTQMDRFLDWLWVAYPQWVDPADHSQGLKTKNAANLALAFDDWVAAQWQGVKDAVKRQEQIDAAQAASAAVTDIDA